MAAHPDYDVFLSHHGADTPAVEALAQRLLATGIQPWLDVWHLPAGQGWQRLIEQALGSCTACVVFVGAQGLGRWQELEIEVALDHWVRSGRTFPLVTVLLPGADRSSVRPFLNTATWVEFRNSLDDEAAFSKLVAGIRGLGREPTAALPTLTVWRAPIDLPTGTVTFLFSDVAGSTRLWEEDAAAMRRALIRHDALFELSVATAGGLVVRPRGEGDSRFAVFTQASSAVAAASAFQQALDAEPWPTPKPLRVRAALHTGEADLRDGDYYGPEVNRCARLRGLAHPGQTLLSQVTARLAATDLPPGAGLLELGLYRLKDVAQPEVVVQLDVPGLANSFPPLVDGRAQITNLPAPLTRLIGREGELVELCELLRRPELRLLSLIGPGGTGKTRLVIATARAIQNDELTGLAFADGVCFVDLAPISSPDLVAVTIAQALGIAEQGEQPMTARLLAYLRPKALLLLLDNFEQVLDAAPLLSDLLTASPALKILVTSRAALRLSGEHEYAVEPLELPDPQSLPPLDALGRTAAVALFVERAQAVRRSFALSAENAAAVAEICVRLDGLPLAIELAAARSKLLAPADLLRHLSSPLMTLTGGSRDRPSRHQTLRATIDWSYRLLRKPEQWLFTSLGLFVGGCTQEAAAAVAAESSTLASLEALIDHSLLRQREGAGGELRFVMLETLREYALEQLDQRGERTKAQARHASYYLGLAEQAAWELRGSRQEHWLARLEEELDNLRAALAWSLSAATQPRSLTVTETVGEALPLGLRLGAALWRFWYLRGYRSEGRRWLEQLVALPGPASTTARAEALNGLAVLSDEQGDYEHAVVLFEESLKLFRTLDDRQGIAHVLSNLGVVFLDQGDYAQATAQFEESLALCREIGDQWTIAVNLGNLGIIAQEQGNLEQAQALYKKNLELVRQLGDESRVANPLLNLGLIAYAQRDDRQAQALYEESLAICRELGDIQGIAHALSNLSWVALRQGKFDQAQAFFAEALRLFQELDEPRGIAECLEGLAGVAASQNADLRAARLCGAAEALRDEHGTPLPPDERTRYEQSITAVRARLGDAAYQAALLVGRTLPLEQAIATALAP